MNEPQQLWMADQTGLNNFVKCDPWKKRTGSKLSQSQHISVLFFAPVGSASGTFPGNQLNFHGHQLN
jgi:hypothetical protein